MDKQTIRRLRGLNDVLADAVDVGVARTEQIHQSIARHPYAVLKRIGPVAAPVAAIEFVQTTITVSVYWTLRLATRVSGAAVAQVLEHLDTRDS
jgi:hypothetical protein